MVGGVVTLSVGYFIALVGATIGAVNDLMIGSQYGTSCSRDVYFSYLPVVGPFINAATFPSTNIYNKSLGVVDCASAHGPVVGISIVDGVLQVGGLGMLITGMVLNRKPTEPQPAGLVGKRFEWGTIDVLPTAPSTYLGLSLRVTL